MLRLSLSDGPNGREPPSSNGRWRLSLFLLPPASILGRGLSISSAGSRSPQAFYTTGVTNACSESANGCPRSGEARVSNVFVDGMMIWCHAAVRFCWFTREPAHPIEIAAGVEAARSDIRPAKPPHDAG